jgi:ABC-type multidrug transport system permease subunit
VSATSLSSQAERTPPTRGWRPGAVGALARRDWRVTRSYRMALVSDLGFGFLNLVTYYYISKTVKPGGGHNLDRAPDYFSFAAVGIALTLVLQASVLGLSRRLREEQLTGTLEALLAQPISTPELAAGIAGFPFLFAVVRAFLYLLLAALLLGLSFAHCNWAGLVISFLVAGLSFAGLGIALAAAVLVFKRAEAIGALGTFGLALVGGAFFARTVLPAWLRPVSDIVPTQFAFTAVRHSLFGGHGWIGPLLLLAGVGAITIAVALALFEAALRYTVKHGTLNQY